LIPPKPHTLLTRQKKETKKQAKHKSTQNTTRPNLHIAMPRSLKQPLEPGRKNQKYAPNFPEYNKKASKLCFQCDFDRFAAAYQNRVGNAFGMFLFWYSRKFPKTMFSISGAYFRNMSPIPGAVVGCPTSHPSHSRWPGKKNKQKTKQHQMQKMRTIIFKRSVYFDQVRYNLTKRVGSPGTSREKSSREEFSREDSSREDSSRGSP